MKEQQLSELAEVLERAHRAYERFSGSAQDRFYAARYDEELVPEFMRAGILSSQLDALEKVVSGAIDRPDALAMSSIGHFTSGENLEKVWECMFVRECANYNARMFSRQIQELRDRRAREEGVPYPTCNTEANLLNAKVGALRDNWRAPGVVEILVQELVDELKKRQVDASAVDPAVVWKVALGCLRVAVEEYEAAVGRYVESIRILRSALGETG